MEPLLIQKSLVKFIAIVALLILGSTSVRASSEIFTAFFSDLAVSGYDAVAYFVDNKAVKGNPGFRTDYKGATWQFKNKENLRSFLADPEIYAPQYGGYCAWAVAQNETASGDPELWTIHNGKLYLNYDTDILDKWLADKEALIIEADKNWPGVL